MKTLGNQELQSALRQAVRTAREATAEAIALLAEVGARRLHVEEGYASLFTYCVEALGSTKNQAWRWSRAAKAAGNIPDLVDRLRTGKLSLCVAALLADRPDLLAAADGITKDEAERRLRAVVPKAPRRDVVLPARRQDIGPAAWRQDVDQTAKNAAPPCPIVNDGTVRLPEEKPRPQGVEAARPVGAHGEAHSKQTSPGDATDAEPSSHSASRPLMMKVEAISPQASRLHCDVSDETLAKIRRAKELLRGQDLDAILAAALDALLDKKDPLRRHERRLRRQVVKAKGARAAAGTTSAGKTNVPKPPRRKSLPIALADAVHAAASGQCSWTAASGKRCTERAYCDKDHVRPLAFAGLDDAENLRLLCRAHHVRVTEMAFPRTSAAGFWM